MHPCAALRLRDRRLVKGGVHAGQQVATRRRRVLIVIQKGEMRFRESETKPVGVNPGASPERGRLARPPPFGMSRFCSAKALVGARDLNRKPAWPTRAGHPASCRMTGSAGCVTGYADSHRHGSYPLLRSLRPYRGGAQAPVGESVGPYTPQVLPVNIVTIAGLYRGIAGSFL